MPLVIESEASEKTQSTNALSIFTRVFFVFNFHLDDVSLTVFVGTPVNGKGWMDGWRLQIVYVALQMHNFRFN